uniref:Uncharacterized protein n=1 Tax=Pseudo-nitzschia australis TaxID=44445 RepID=A0A7S4EGS3_9STRA
MVGGNNSSSSSSSRSSSRSSSEGTRSVPPLLLRGGHAQGLRFLGGGNNNNNNNNNNNQNQRQRQQNDQYGNNENNNMNYDSNNNWNGNASYKDFNPALFAGTICFCAFVTLVVVLRMRLHRRTVNRRKRLGLPPVSREKRKRSKSGDNQDENIITDEEIHRYVLPSKQEQSVKEASKVFRYDRETERIMDLCKPFWTEAFVSGICDVLNSALVGKTLGVDSLSIYYIVTVPTAFTETIISAVLETISSLGGQSVGVGSYKLTGQYCQISIILYTILYIPHAILWITCLKPTLRWFAPNLGEEVIEEGYNYFLVSLIGTYIEAFSTVLHSLLEVTDNYGYGMKSGVVHNIVSVLGFFIYVKVNPEAQKSIVWVETIWTVMTFVFLAIDLFVSKRMKWFDDFWNGTSQNNVDCCTELYCTRTVPWKCSVVSKHSTARVSFACKRTTDGVCRTSLIDPGNNNQRNFAFCGDEKLGGYLACAENCSSSIDREYHHDDRMGVTRNLCRKFGWNPSRGMGYCWHYLGDLGICHRLCSRCRRDPCRQVVGKRKPSTRQTQCLQMFVFGKCLCCNDEYRIFGWPPVYSWLVHRRSGTPGIGCECLALLCHRKLNFDRWLARLDTGWCSGTILCCNPPWLHW